MIDTHKHSGVNICRPIARRGILLKKKLLNDDGLMYIKGELVTIKTIAIKLKKSYIYVQSIFAGKHTAPEDFRKQMEILCGFQLTDDDFKDIGSF